MRIGLSVRLITDHAQTVAVSGPSSIIQAVQEAADARGPARASRGEPATQRSSGRTVTSPRAHVAIPKDQ